MNNIPFEYVQALFSYFMKQKTHILYCPHLCCTAKQRHFTQLPNLRYHIAQGHKRCNDSCKAQLTSKALTRTSNFKRDPQASVKTVPNAVDDMDLSADNDEIADESHSAAVFCIPSLPNCTLPQQGSNYQSQQRYSQTVSEPTSTSYALSGSGYQNYQPSSQAWSISQEQKINYQTSSAGSVCQLHRSYKACEASTTAMFFAPVTLPHSRSCDYQASSYQPSLYQGLVATTPRTASYASSAYNTASQNYTAPISHNPFQVTQPSFTPPGVAFSNPGTSGYQISSHQEQSPATATTPNLYQACPVPSGYQTQQASSISTTGQASASQYVTAQGSAQFLPSSSLPDPVPVQTAAKQDIYAEPIQSECPSQSSVPTRPTVSKRRNGLYVSEPAPKRPKLIQSQSTFEVLGEVGERMDIEGSGHHKLQYHKCTNIKSLS